MKKKWIKIQIPLRYVKRICVGAVFVGLLFVVSGMWAAGLCMLLGAYILEKSQYCCPVCGKKLDMKYPLFRGACCPFCRAKLREDD